MTVFVAFHPENHVKGAGVLSALRALGENEVLDVCNKHGVDLDSLSGDSTLLQQKELDVLHDLSDAGYFSMVGAGMKIPEVAEFPPDIQDVHSALASLNVAYQMNVEGEEIGEYAYEKVDDRKAIMICNNPYPSDFDYGIIYGLVKRFRDAESKRIAVIRDETKPNRTNTGEECRFTVEW